MSVVFSFNIKKSRKNNPKAGNLSGGGLYLKGDSDKTIILIHGLTGTPNEMKFLAGFFNENRYSVLCPRLANHGAPIKVLKDTKWQDFYASVREALLKEGSLKEGRKIFVAGLSMGAIIALLLADEFKEKITAVSCLAPTLFYDGWNTPSSKFLLPLAYGTLLKHFFYFKEDPPYGIKNEIIQRRIDKYYKTATLEDIDNISQYGYPYFPVTLLHQLQLLIKHAIRVLPAIRVPVQLIQAKDDDMASVRNSKFIYDKISSEIKEMILLYDSYHVITADQERDTVAEKMKEFFNRINNGMKITPKIV